MVANLQKGLEQSCKYVQIFEFRMDDRYHIDEIINWICSCPAYSHNPYLLCKHSVAKKCTSPTYYMETIRCHDYPLVFFGVPSISQENDPCERYELTMILLMNPIQILVICRI